MVEPDVAGLAESLRLWRRALPMTWVPALLVSLLWIAGPAWMLRGVLLQQDPFAAVDAAQLIVGTGLFWGATCLYLALSVLPLAAMFACLAACAAGRPAPAGLGLGIALRRFPAALAGALVFTFFTTLASFAFVLPGAVLWVMWQLWIVALLEEGVGPFAALARSWRLTAHGSWWRAAALPTLAGVAAIIAWLLADGVASILLALARPDTARAMAYSVAVQCLLGSVLLSLVPAMLVLLYRELRTGNGAAGG